MRLLAVYPHPSPVELPIPSDVRVVPAMPGGPTVVLGINSYPPFICDVAVVKSPEGLPAAIEVVLGNKPDPRIYSKADYLRDILGAREMSEYELTLEDPDYSPYSVVFR